MSEHRMQHQPDPDGAPMHDVEEAFPDLYEQARLYDYGAPYQSALGTIKRVRGNPDAEVKVFRAVPDPTMTINPSDWVTPSYIYAKEHGRHATDPARDMPIISRTVRAGELRTEGNSVCEWGWFPTAKGMDEPHACDECGAVYDEARGDGYNGRCPSCADASEPTDA